MRSRVKQPPAFGRRQGALRSLLFAAVSLAAIVVAADAQNAISIAADRRMDLLMPFEELDEGVLRIEVPGIAAQDLVAQYSGDTLFVPYLSVCDFLQITCGISADNTLLTGEFPGGRHFDIRRGSGHARIGSDTVPISPTAIRMVADEVYIEPGALFRVLGIVASFDLAHVTLRIAADDRIPLVERHRGRQRHAFLEGDGSSAMPHASLDRHLLGAPVVDWMASMGGTTPWGSGDAPGSVSGHGIARLHLGAELLYGELEAGLSSSLPEDGVRGRISVDSWNWRFFLPEFSPLRRITLGSVAVGGGQLLGIELGNAPLAPRVSFDDHEMSGQTQPGWTVEMYDGSRLVGSTVADSLGRYALRTPVGYGTADRTLKHLGLHGEVITEPRRLQLAPQMIPAGDVEYDLLLGAGHPHSDSPAVAAGRVSLGIFDRLTLGLEGSARLPRLGALRADSASLSLSAAMWLGESGALTLRYRGNERLFAGAYSYVSADNITLRAAVDSLSLRSRTMVSMLAGTLPLGRISLGGSGRFATTARGTSIEAASRVSGYIAGLNFQASTRLLWPALWPAWRGDTVAVAGKATAPDIVSSLRLIATPVQGLLLSADATYEHATHSLAALDLSAYIRPFSVAGINLSCSVPNLMWSRATLRVQVDVGLGVARIFTAASHENNQIGTSLVAQGNVGFSGSGVHLSPDFSVGRSAIVLRAFHDDNHNGSYDPGERRLGPPPAELIQGTMRMTSDDGVFTSLMPNTQWLLEVDQWGFAADGLFPGRTRYTVASSPSAIVTLDIPYAEGFDVMGTCGVERQTPAGDMVRAPVSLSAGLRIYLRALSGGSEYEGEVFSDGTIIIPGVGAGRYTLAFDPGQLASRRLEHASTAGEIALDAEHTRLPAITLKRAGP